MAEKFAVFKEARVGMVRRAWAWFAGELIHDVPEDLALCEFDCRKPQCTYSEWSSCERRLKRAEELMSMHTSRSPKRS